MQRTIFLIIVLLLSCCYIPSSWAQQPTIKAGQTAGLLVTTLNPAVSLIGANIPYAPGATIVKSDKDSLDLDADGRYDIGLLIFQSVHRPAGPPPTDYESSQYRAELYPLHSDMQLLSYHYAIRAFVAGDILSDSLDNGTWCRWSACEICKWRERDEINTLYSLYIGSRSFGYRGLWSDTEYRYVYIRMRTNGQWRNGWLSVQVNKNFDITVNAYALQSLVLATARATTSAAWAMFPSPTTGLATLQLARPTTGELTVLDALGRVAYQRTLKGQTQHILDLSLLPAGLYLVQLATPDGRTTQRLQKL